MSYSKLTYILSARDIGRYFDPKMGYTTDFEGHFDITPPLTPEHRAYINRFGDTRRMSRYPMKAEKLPDDLRKAVGLPIGIESEYFVGAAGPFGQVRDDSILDFNKSPMSQPGLWCQWVATDDGTQLVWDQSEKFYMFVSWLEYMVTHFFQPWGYILNGKVYWQGEDHEDNGVIYLENNREYDSIRDCSQHDYPTLREIKERRAEAVEINQREATFMVPGRLDNKDAAHASKFVRAVLRHTTIKSSKMTTIWKYPITGRNPNQYGEFEIMMPVGAKPLSVQMKDGAPCMWAQVNVNGSTKNEQRRFYIAGTGKEQKVEGQLTYVDTWQEGEFVWHLYAIAPAATMKPL